MSDILESIVERIPVNHAVPLITGALYRRTVPHLAARGYDSRLALLLQGLPIADFTDEELDYLTTLPLGLLTAGMTNTYRELYYRGQYIHIPSYLSDHTIAQFLVIVESLRE